MVKPWEAHAEIVISDDESKRMKSGPSSVADPAGRWLACGRKREVRRSGLKLDTLVSRHAGLQLCSCKALKTSSLYDESKL